MGEIANAAAIGQITNAAAIGEIANAAAVSFSAPKVMARSCFSKQGF
jgi:hypothetical protein